jgi:hypothetical protein
MQHRMPKCKYANESLFNAWGVYAYKREPTKP